MVKRIGLIALCALVSFNSFSQRRKKTTKAPLVFADSAAIQKRADSLMQVAKAADTLTNQDAGIGLKNLLQTAATKTTEKLSATNGFLYNPLVKIGVPPEDQKLERGLRSLGYGKQVDQAVASMNLAAEDATKGVAPLFADAIKNTSLNNAKQLLKGSDSSGSSYLRQLATASLTSSVRPIVVASIEKAGTAKYWAQAFSSINKFGLNKTNTDLAGYITDKTVAGIFAQMEKEEQALRTSPETKASEFFQKLYKQ